MNTLSAIFIYIEYLILQCSSQDTTSGQNPNNAPGNFSNIGLTNNASLSNIISYTGVNFRFIEMITTTQKNLFIKTSSSLSTGERVFFGLQYNGRFYFNNKAITKEVMVYDKSDNQKGGAESCGVLININNTEYWLSIGKEDYHMELFDLESSEIIFNDETQNILNIYVYSYQNSAFKLTTSDSDNYYFYGAIIKNDDNSYSLSIGKYGFSFINSELTANADKTYKMTVAQTKISTCFQAENKMIACYIINTNSYYEITVFDQSLNLIKSNEISQCSTYDSAFHKCIHLTNNVGVFIHFASYYTYIPEIFLKIINQNGTTDNYLSANEKINIAYEDMDPDIVVNDLIKLDDTKFCSIGCSKDRDKIYVSVFLMDSVKVLVNCYTINIYSVYNYKIYRDTQAILFNNFVALGSSFCNSDSCSNGNSYGALIVFSYPNSTDIYLDIVDFLCNISNSNNYENIIFNLTEYIIIENNIFNFSLSKIKIIDVPDSDLIKIISLYNNSTMKANDNLTIDNSKIQISFLEEIYYEKNYIMKYVPIAIGETTTQPTPPSVSSNQPTTSPKSSTSPQQSSTSPQQSSTNQQPSTTGPQQTSTKTLRLIAENTSPTQSASQTTMNNPPNQLNQSFFDDEYIGRATNLIIHFKTISNEDYQNSNCVINIKNNGYCIYPNSSTKQLCFLEEIEEEELEEEEKEEKEELLEEEEKEEKREKKEEVEQNKEEEKEREKEEKEIEKEKEKGKEEKEEKEKEKEEKEIEKEKEKGKEEKEEKEKEKEKEEKEKEKEKEEKGDEKEEKREKFEKKENEENEENQIQIDEKEINKEIVEENDIEKNFVTEEEEINIEANKENITKETEHISISENNIINSKDETVNCDKEKILKNDCKSTITNTQIKEIYDDLKNTLKSGNYTKENKVVETENTVFQLSKLDDQEKTNASVSVVDLGECEDILKEKYDISKEDDLIIFKSEIVENNTGSRFVQYEIYNPNNLEKLDLSHCHDVKISISVPIDLDNSTQTLYEDLKSQGYNMFDSNDAFFTDVCTPYTSENGTDLTMSARQSEIYTSLCQSGCEFVSYNSSTKKVNCDCDPQDNDTQTDSSELSVISKLFIFSFSNILEYSNFLVIKCYTFPFKFNFSSINIGRIIMTILLIAFLVIVIISSNKKDSQLLEFFTKAINDRFGINESNSANKLEAQKKIINELNIKSKKNKKNKKNKKKSSLTSVKNNIRGEKKKKI